MWRRLIHLIYLMITYQLLKLFAAALKKAVRNRVESRYTKSGIFWNRDVVDIGMVVVWISFQLNYLLPSSGKLQIASP